jgi:ERCC4-type nuclease
MSDLVMIDHQEARQHPTLKVGFQTELGPENVIVFDNLPFADFLFYGAPAEGIIPSIGIEVMPLANFLEKIDSRQLSFQVSGMVSRYHIRWLLIEGQMRPDKDGRIINGGGPRSHDFSRARAILRSAQALGCCVDFTLNRADTLKWLLETYRFYQKDPSDHDFFRPQRTAPSLALPLGDPIEEQILAVMHCYGIGEDKARAALAHAGSLLALSLLGEKQLQEIPGWGPTTARRWKVFLAGDTKQVANPVISKYVERFKPNGLSARDRDL